MRFSSRAAIVLTGLLLVLSAAPTFASPAELSQFDAYVFATGGNGKIQLWSGKATTCVQIQPVGGSFDIGAVVLSSIKMVSVGTGSVSEIYAVGKTAVNGDRNKDGIRELTACFSKDDLRLLFSDLGGGKTTVTVSVQGDLANGGHFAGNVDLDVFGKGPGLPASVHFVGALPSGSGVDTLSDLTPFKICWTGSSQSGAPLLYRFDVGIYSSPVSADTCVVINDLTVASSLSLTSGIYSITVTAVDDGTDVASAQFSFVVNHDPETWFQPKGAPVGHYIQHWLYGQAVHIEGTFAPQDTVPYRSTVWFSWDGADTTGGEANHLTGWKLELVNGTRNNGQPYLTEFLDTLFESPLVRFRTNAPDIVGPAGFADLILDSLDAGRDMYAVVASRDGAGRVDGTPASFTFNCNFPPAIYGIPTVADTIATVDAGVGPENCKVIRWVSFDFEDGLAIRARVIIDGTEIYQISSSDQFLLLPYRVLLSLPYANPHSASVTVIDRAGDESQTSAVVEFAPPTSAPSMVTRGSEVPEGRGVPAVLRFLPARPNPFRGGGELSYGLPRGGRVRLAVYDVHGRRVAVVLDGVEPAGWRSVIWDGRNSAGREVGSGTYFLRLEVGGSVQVRKMVVAR